MTETLPSEITLSARGSCPFDPPPEVTEQAKARPITPIRFPDGHIGQLITNYTLARAVLADPRFSARQELRHIPIPNRLADGEMGPADPGMFIRMDPPQHTRYRRLLTGQFTVRHMNLLVPRIERITAEHLDAMAEQGPPADLVKAFALPIPSLVICELLGVPYSDREVFQQHTSTMLRLDSTSQEVYGAIGKVNEYLDGLVEAKKASPAEDLLSGLITGGELNQEELVTIGFLLLVAGHETTANMLGLGSFALLSNPAQLAALRADPTLVDGAVEELLRYLSIIQIGIQRTALEDVDLDGHHFKKGDGVLISVPAANRDPERFEHPEQLNITRPNTGHLAFGHGVHQCLGQQLARIEMRVGYRALFERFPDLRLAIPADEVPMRSDMAIYGVHRLPVMWEEVRQ
ncbi:Cytochrome P450 [Sinosporangium album]|uniref:Cytochrome P450 n=1 Tax=Sinosporangium album TaxID=504805 RepID=A0A1G7UJV0_9ACTN|nr:cytochrome P450 [Sinosporangium album]SDG47020.1 Cytochrome P450 [Sinosporangium album]